MKRRLTQLCCTLVLMAGYCYPVWSQDRNNEDEVIKVDPRASRYRSVDGEVLVKFKESTPAKVSKLRSGMLRSGISTVDQVLSGYQVEVMEQLLPNEQPGRTLRSALALNGQTVTESNLSQLYRLKIKAEVSKSTIQLVNELKELPEVEFAEPNYIVSVTGKPAGETISSLKAAAKKATRSAAAYSEEPMYPMQWGIPAVKLDALWQKPVTATKRAVIAIIDTGVDTDHPDLKDNIWTNPGESGKTTGYDDDNNGFADDVHGWDFVNQTANVKDFNSHGTHCAGIAAAVGNNSMGIAGASPDALIMPVAVMQSNGTGDIATLIKGINYAANNGADVISMSIGTYAYSIALQQALAQAYQTCVLVAAAGNDGFPIDCRCGGPPCGQMFPAAFTFVLGVEATQQNPGLYGYRASWSNYDCDGAVYSAFGEEQQYNYELKAPGASIISTVPGGQYRSYNGTSMATPLVAGGIAALKVRKEFASQEILWSTLIQSSSETQVDFDSAYQYVPKPKLSIVSVQVNDTLSGDKDMHPDAGETIQIYPTIRNTGGQVDSIYYSLGFAEFEDASLVDILQDSVKLGYSLSAYAKMRSKNPVTIKIKPTVVDGRNIRLVLKSWYGSGHKGEVSQNLTLNVESGVELKGMVMQDLTLYPNTHYIVTSNLGIPNGVTLTIKPGTVLKIKDNVKISCAGKIRAIGKPDSMIVFTKTDLGIGWGGMIFSPNDVLKYVKIEYINQNVFQIALAYNSTGGTHIGNSIVQNCSNMDIMADLAPFYKSNFYNNVNYGGLRFLKEDYYGMNDTLVSYNNIINFTNGYDGLIQANGLPFKSNIFSNTTGRGNYSVWIQSATPTVFYSRFQNYYGSSLNRIISNSIFDFNTPNSNSFAVYDLSNTVRRPYAEAHGIVWKVVVDGSDSQDAFDSLPPLGVGKHKFEVWFNRPMNKSATPTLTMGVRPPYTQNAIAEEGSWNAAGDIYTAYYTIKAASNTDGLNRIYVADARDNENFEIPVEDKRYNVIVQAAGSMSNGFEATPGLGKIALNWEVPEGYFDDLLGYNLYRFTYDSEGVSSDTVLINPTLVTDTTYTDYDVVPGKTYNYMYKVLRTNLTENNFSKVVSTAPLTATKGDANGSFSVDVADVVTTVNYVTNQDPKPFIFEAADVNADATIDILDVVGIINIILNPTGASMRSANTAIYSIEDGLLYVDSPVALGGVQFRITAPKGSASVEALTALNGFEQAALWQNDSTYFFMAYSLSGKEIPAGKTALLRINGPAELNQVVFSDGKGQNVIGVSSDVSNIAKEEGNQLLKLYPNPFRSALTIPYTIGTNSSAKVEFIFTDLLGRIVDRHQTYSANAGQYQYIWSPSGSIASGVYFCSLRINSVVVQTEKVVLQR